MFKPVQKKSLADAVFEQLREEIVSGRMEPGEALPAERMLSDMLGVNRGAVREALKRLEQARLISIQQGGATRVLDYRETAGTDLLSALLIRPDASINTHVARSILEMREAIAADIARLCAQRATTEHIVTLADHVATMKEAARDLPALQDMSMAFWRLMAEGADNVAYLLVVNSLDESYSKFKRLLLHVMAEEFTDLDRYAAIVRAVADRDPDEAATEARALMHIGHSLIEQVLVRLDEG